MKKVRDRTKGIILLILSVPIIISEVLHAFNDDLSKNKNLFYFMRITEVIFLIIAIWLLFSLLKKTLKYIWKSHEKMFGKILNFLFKPIYRKIMEWQERRKSFIKGVNENKFVWDSGNSGKLKRNSRYREKLNLRRCRSNGERVRLYYIKFILQSLKKGYNINYTETPREIKGSLDVRESGVLFDTYEKVRYCENAEVSDEEAELCGEAAESL